MPGVTGVTVSLVPLLARQQLGQRRRRRRASRRGPDTDNNSRFNEVGAGLFLDAWACR